LVLMAHLDVVPVINAAGWSRAPFAGLIEEGAIWGRGTLDDKGSLLGILEAVEALLKAGFAPQRTIYLAFGHDEEMGGAKGAAAIVRHLKSRGVAIGAVLDEGMAVTEGQLPFRSTPVAIIGLAEKGYVSVQLSVDSPGGHSSMPPPKSAVGELATAIHRLEANQMPGHLDGPVRLLLETLAPEVGYPERLALANLWVLGPVIKSVLLDAAPTAALVRTTTAATMMSGSEKENVLPQEASAVINYRILPGDSVEGVLSHVRAVIANPRIKIQALPLGSEPSAIAPTDTPAYRALAKSIREVFADTIVVPGLVLAATDARHYSDLTPNIYHFVPLRFSSDDKGRIHGKDERIKTSNYAEVIFCYMRFIENFGGQS
jgi:carboxypeptidase PM20D1